MVCLVVQAQSLQVSGTIVSKSDGQPVIGATILEQGTTNGTITDFDGKFSLTVKQGAEISISYIGFKTQVVKAQNVLDIVLEEDTEVLDEVVVTAMGIKRSEKALGYSATSVNGEKISASRTSDVMSSLAGKVAGVQISATSSDPGASNSVIIRGVSSLSGCNQPLYVVDGVALENSSGSSSDGLN